MRYFNHKSARAYALASLAAASLTFTMASHTAAQICGTDYEIKQGDTLAQIAGQVYGNPAQWTIIFYANQDRLGANASLLVPGLSIRIPCINNADKAKPLPKAAVTPAQPAISERRFMLSSLVKRIEFLTADGFSPFADRSLRDGGMLTHVVTAAMEEIKTQSSGKFDYGISWVNDWSAHLNPLLTTRAFDVGFPWSRPECENFARLDKDGKYRCQRFFFSKPLYEVLTQTFVKKGSPIKSASNDEMKGKTVCRAAGEGLYELDDNGKNWVKDDIVTLVRPETVDDCFELLKSGGADAVIATDLAGQAAITGQGLTDDVEIIESPIAIGTMHVIISKTHPHARTILYYVNEALVKLKQDGTYSNIVEDHLAAFWNTDTGGADTVSGATPPSGDTPKATPARTPSDKKDNGKSSDSGPSELANGKPTADARKSDTRK